MYGGQNAPRRPAQPQGEGQDGFFEPGQEGFQQNRPVQRGRMVSAGQGVPRPVSTARGAGGGPVEPNNRDKNLWQIITVLAIILVIIVVAIVLVIRLNRPTAPAAASDPYENATVITSSTAEPSPTPAGTPGIEAPEGLIVPDATPVPAPSASPVTVTPVPSPESSPSNFSTTQVNDTVYISGNGVNIRSGPGTDYNILGSESTGKQLQRTGKTSNGWSQVSYNGQTGYVLDSFVTTTQPAASNNGTSTNFNVTAADGTVTVASSIGANLRSGPGQDYSVVATVANNTQLTRTGVSGGWTQVNYNGQNVFISTNLLQGSSGSTGSTGSSSGGSGTITGTGNGVRIRSGPGTGYGVIGAANSGNVLTLLGQNGDWYQVSYNGSTGYISASYARKN